MIGEELPSAVATLGNSSQPTYTAESRYDNTQAQREPSNHYPEAHKMKAISNPAKLHPQRSGVSKRLVMRMASYCPKAQALAFGEIFRRLEVGRD